VKNNGPLWNRSGSILTSSCEIGVGRYSSFLVVLSGMGRPIQQACP
jgi:hypothetical protein